MQLNGKQFRELKEALLSAFPDPAKLKQMVFFGFNKQNLDEIATGNHDDVVFELIKWAETYGNLENLLIAARSENYCGNPGNPDLKKICAELLEGQAATKQPHHEWLNPCNFDLSELIRYCFNELDDQQGLIGLAVPYDKSNFPIYFCERLQDKLNKSHITIIETTLKPKLGSVDRVVGKIKANKDNLQKSDVICRILVDASNQNTSMTDEFWRKISDEFQNNNTKHRLIVIMFGSENSIFPEGVNKLMSPQFTRADANDWVIKVARQLTWTQECQQKWKKMMIQDCLDQDDSQEKLLDIEYVYEHLKTCIELLQKKPSEEDFLQELEQRIQSYV
ncbi:hypothetical protein SAMD00079811_20600 [Scytonema sp. HK-05]|uniref:effector-associated domain EAD1-containing protein n=1 Tax=Scytonema sp. HK-05 TaxID=1137095 RepID=UPI0009378F23|nr:effector-associated domain EAD1-containing protein [Scytonema sp. HK-05]OKH47354.1 hypothetical protein NIES2130_36040 [Scytonema sp. HK-05]BAY44460.1 hypothetical protein SAMD00079811_20600 [Scytonema sp. HK-05]